MGFRREANAIAPIFVSRDLLAISNRNLIEIESRNRGENVKPSTH